MGGEPEPYLKTVVVLDTCDDVPGVEIIAVATEAEVIAETLGGQLLWRP
jgi:hypothetical protein